MILLIDNYDSFTYNLVQRIGEVFLSNSLSLGERVGVRAFEPSPSGSKSRRGDRGRDEGEQRARVASLKAPSPLNPGALPEGEGNIPDIRVIRNDKISVEEAAALNPTHLILSPGPCTPTESGICPQLIEYFMGRIPILGVCLGHQTIGHVRGMTVKRHHTLMHGKTSEIFHDGRGIYEGLSNPFTATRYHSLIVERDTVPADFEVSAWTKDDEVMGLRWRGGNAETSKRQNAEMGECGRPARTMNDDALARGSTRLSSPKSAEGVSGVERKAYIEQQSPPATLDGVQFHPESFLTVEGPKLLANFLGVGVGIHH